MANLADIFDLELFDEMVAQKYVRLQTHPNLPLTLANYSELAQFSRVWNDVTVNCRGLVYNIANKEVVSRVLPKFHNWGEPESAHLDLDAAVEVTDKLDGSLINISLYRDKPIISSRGSFQSEQAIHAAKLWKEKYEDKFQLLPGWTYIFEVIYPTNRIVLDYGDLDDLVMLAIIENATGLSVPNPAKESGWPGPSAKVFEYKTLAEALAAEPRPNAEGFVVHFLETDERVKLKQEDYVALHRIVTGLNERTVWQHMMDGKPIEELIEPLPDEFHDFCRKVVERIVTEVEQQYHDIVTEFCVLLAKVHAGHPISRGFCECGCGRNTPLAIRKSKDYEVGDPTRYVPWHTLRKVPFFVDSNTGCWLWQGAISSSGYGSTRYTTAHRYVYTLTKGIPREGYDLDHLCRVRTCVNPHHLEEVTRSENSLRGTKTVLTKKQVAEIRSSQNPNTSELAREMDLPGSTVDAVRRGVTWELDNTETVSRPISSEFRKAFAMLASQSPNKWALFSLLDGKEIWSELLKRAKPDAITPAGKLAEETVE